MELATRVRGWKSLRSKHLPGTQVNADYMRSRQTLMTNTKKKLNILVGCLQHEPARNHCT